MGLGRLRQPALIPRAGEAACRSARPGWQRGFCRPSVAGGGGTFQVSGTHTYAGGEPFSVTVTLADAAPGTASATVTSTTDGPSPIPALGGAGLLALGLAFAAAGLLVLRRS